jgi:hypothetical protein
LLAQLKAHDELDQILPAPRHNTIHSPKKEKNNTNSKQKRVSGLKSSNNPKAMAIFLFPRREEGVLASLLIYDSLDAKAQETNFFTLGFDKEPRSSLCVCFLVGIQQEKSTSSFYLLQENLVIHNMYVCG